MVRSALEHAFSVGDQHLDLGPGGQPYKYEFAQSANSADCTPGSRGWRSLLARVQLVPLRARIVLAQRLSPKAKQVVRRILDGGQLGHGVSGGAKGPERSNRDGGL